jgi:glycosyltransferase involved in cell wall biosynthesis
MKIAMLGVKAVPAIGGIARYVEELGARLAERGHQVTVYCRPHYMNGQDQYYRGMRRVVTRGVSGKHLDALTHTLTAALHAVRQDFDILHVHGCGPGALLPLLRAVSRSKMVLTIHGLEWEAKKWSRVASWLIYQGASLSASWAHRIVAVGEHIRQFYRERLGADATVVPTGINLPHLPGPQQIGQLGLEPGKYLFCAARFVPEKGLHLLMDAFQRLDTDKKLVIAGDWAYEDAYVKKLLASRNERILFPGYVTGRLLAELYTHCHIYVQPSLLEGVSVAVLEALSYGCCVLASDIPGNLEALGPCGYTFASGDADSLYEKLEWLLAHPEKISDQFQQARQYVAEERNWDKTTDGYEAVYQELLGSRVSTRHAVQRDSARDSARSTAR